MAKNSRNSRKFKQRQREAKQVAVYESEICRYNDNPNDGVPQWNTTAFMKHMATKNYKECYAAVIKFLKYFDAHHYKGYGQKDVRQFDDMINCVTLLMTTSEALVEGPEAFQLVSTGHMFSNIVASSHHGTTDTILKQAIAEGNLVKLLFLQNARCGIQGSIKVMFDAHPQLATLWYNTYLLGCGAPTDKQQANLHNHIKNIDPRWTPINENVTAPLFTATYLNQADAKNAKEIMNNSIKKGCSLKFNNNPDPKSIAIVTSKWHRNHAVYKSASPLVNQLREKYKLTLIHLGEGIPDTLVTEGFDKVEYIKFSNQQLRVPETVINNDFQFVYYPDIGMVDEGVWLSNHRMAPIQAVGYGHPDTTGCSEIDYFIGGDVEADCADKYTEKLVCLPGLAQHPAWPTAPRQNNWEPSDIVRINCVWGPDKYNATLLRVLAEVNKRCGTDGHEWHFFPSPGINRYAGLVPWMRDIVSLLPNSHAHTDVEYYDYMRDAEKNDFSLNSFPFGCYNVLIESLYLGLPFVALEGDRFYNRAGSHLLRQLGMENLNSQDVVGYIDIICDLIQNKERLATERSKLASLDLKELLFKVEDTHFLTAVDHIIANHPLTTNPTLIGELYGSHSV